MKKKLLAAALFVIAIMPAMLLFNTVKAAPDHIIYVIYYSDATYTTQVGTFYWGCAGPPNWTGQHTQFQKTEFPNGMSCDFWPEF